VNGEPVLRPGAKTNPKEQYLKTILRILEDELAAL
jgi:hypothetical protein